jgi:hypothetical protein
LVSQIVISKGKCISRTENGAYKETGNGWCSIFCHQNEKVDEKRKGINQNILGELLFSKNAVFIACLKQLQIDCP